MPPPDAASRTLLQEQVETVLHTLDHREKRIILMLLAYTTAYGKGAARPAEPLRWRLGGAGVIVDVCLPAVLFLHVPVWNVHVVQCGVTVLVRVGGQQMTQFSPLCR